MTHQLNLAATTQPQWTTGFGLWGLWLVSQCFPNKEAKKLDFFFVALMWFVVCCWLTPTCEQIMTWRCIPLPWRQVAYTVCLSSADTNSSRVHAQSDPPWGLCAVALCWLFSTGMMQNSNFSLCTFQSDAIVIQDVCVCVCLEHGDIFRYANETRCFCHALRQNFSRGTVTSSSTRSSTKAVFCLCGELLFS